MAIVLVKSKLMKKMAGVFKGTKVATDAFWKDVLKRKSRKENIVKHFSRIDNLKIISTGK